MYTKLILFPSNIWGFCKFWQSNPWFTLLLICFKQSCPVKRNWNCFVLIQLIGNAPYRREENAIPRNYSRLNRGKPVKVHWSPIGQFIGIEVPTVQNQLFLSQIINVHSSYQYIIYLQVLYLWSWLISNFLKLKIYNWNGCGPHNKKYKFWSEQIN